MFSFSFSELLCQSCLCVCKTDSKGRSAERDEGMVVLFNLFQPFCFGEPLSNALHSIDEFKMR